MLLVAGALGAVIIAPNRPVQYPIITGSLGLYLAYSLAIVALVWRPLGFGRGWAVALHLFDMAVFSWLTLITEGTASPLFISYVFLVICGTLRWQMRGALATGAISVLAFGAVTLVPSAIFGVPGVAAETFPVRAMQLAIISGLLAYLGAYHQRFQREISRLAAWPREIPDDREDLARELVSQSAKVLGAPRVVLVWEEPVSGYVNVAWMEAGEVTCRQEREGTYASLVAPRLEHTSFQAWNAADENGRVVYRVDSGFRQCNCRPVNEALRARFRMATLQSWALEGELVRGRLFSLDKPKMEIDDLVVGELAARLAVSRLESLYMLQDIRRAVALGERVKVASDLHDSLLQSLAGTALQLMAARRLLDRDRDKAAAQLDEVQRQIEQGELEMRSFIRRLRPEAPIASEVSPIGLAERLRGLAERIERQWSVKVTTDLDPSADGHTGAIGDEVFRIAREGILNAARHADASAIALRLSVANGALTLEIADDGRGFPFQGRYNLKSLERLNQGPWSLKERIIGLHGTLELTSTGSGSRLLITLPLSVMAG
ncbi:MAG TPA: sensor histidine kinase [Vicinamibacterales bacterium]|nr:sensor histidine kinase [Vicinamibacterales bacterium]